MLFRSELKNSEYRKCLHPLTEGDITRMQELAVMPEYRDVIKYMLEHRVKLEQEIISLKLMERVFGNRSKFYENH